MKSSKKSFGKSKLVFRALIIKVHNLYRLRYQQLQKFIIFTAYFLDKRKNNMDDEDNTVVLDMKREFQKFVSSDDHRKRSRLDASEDVSFLDTSHSSAVSSVRGRNLLFYALL